MKVVAFNGSPRREGNTAILIRRVFRELEQAGIETELVQLADEAVRGCIACERCAENRDRRCSVGNDGANACLEKMLAADGIILGSPVYFQDVTPEMKALIDRAGYVARANGRMLRNRLGAALATLRRSGGTCALDTMDHFFLANQMIVVGRAVAFGREIGAVERDLEGMELAELLGKRMAWLLEKVYG
jgi:multimeric flavodoxin WrbA